MLKEELEKLINKDNLSYREIGKIMNMSDNGVKKEKIEGVEEKKEQNIINQKILN